MTPKLALTVNAVASAFFALLFILVPEQALDFYGQTDVNDDTLTMARWFGSGLVGYAALAWLARELAASDARRVIMLGIIVAWAASLGMTLFVLGTGRINAMGWTSVVLDLAFIGVFVSLLREAPAD